MRLPILAGRPCGGPRGRGPDWGGDRRRLPSPSRPDPATAAL